MASGFQSMVAWHVALNTWWHQTSRWKHMQSRLLTSQWPESKEHERRAMPGTSGHSPSDCVLHWVISQSSPLPTASTVEAKPSTCEVWRELRDPSCQSPEIPWPGVGRGGRTVPHLLQAWSGMDHAEDWHWNQGTQVHTHAGTRQPCAQGQHSEYLTTGTLGTWAIYQEPQLCGGSGGGVEVEVRATAN